jgi:hypothetical protein
MATKRQNSFEPYLSLWVGQRTVAGMASGLLAPALMDGLRRLSFPEPQGSVAS